MSQFTHPVYRDTHLADLGLDIQPSHDQVLVAKLPTERLGLSSSGVLHVPETAGRRDLIRNTFGQVIAVGPDVRLVKKGEVVHFDQYAGMDARWESHFNLTEDGQVEANPVTLPQDRQYVLLSEMDIDLVIELEVGEPIPLLHDA